MPSNSCIRDGKYGKISSPKKDEGRLVGQVQGVGRGWGGGGCGRWGIAPPHNFLILFEVKRALT